jgi:hypothetical protein
MNSLTMLLFLFYEFISFPLDTLNLNILIILDDYLLVIRDRTIGIMMNLLRLLIKGSLSRFLSSCAFGLRTIGWRLFTCIAIILHCILVKCARVCLEINERLFILLYWWCIIWHEWILHLLISIISCEINSTVIYIPIMK